MQGAQRFLKTKKGTHGVSRVSSLPRYAPLRPVLLRRDAAEAAAARLTAGGMRAAWPLCAHAGGARTRPAHGLGAGRAQHAAGASPPRWPYRLAAAGLKRVCGRPENFGVDSEWFVGAASMARSPATMYLQGHGGNGVCAEVTYRRSTQSSSLVDPTRKAPCRWIGGCHLAPFQKIGIEMFRLCCYLLMC